MRVFLNCVGVLGALALFALAPCNARAVPTIRLTPSRSTILADGRDSTQISAEVRDNTGRLVADGTQVTFQTSLGTFQRAGVSATVSTQSGSARVLLSSATKGTAAVTAASTGGGFERTEVVFTDDPSETFEGNSYAVVVGDSALVYAAGERTIEAVGKDRKDPEKETAGARLRFRNIELSADDLLVDCNTSTVRAQGNVVLRRGGRRIRCLKLVYPLLTSNGLAVADVNHHWRPVSIKGTALTVTLRTEPVPAKMLEMVSMADARQLISAKQILLFPGDKLQFKRPRFFQDGQALVSLPFYSLSLFAGQLFADQFVSIGSQGLGVNFPLYYDMTPSTTGLIRLRNGERYGTSVSATRPGLALDITQSYSSLAGGHRYTGDFGFTDVNRNDWGFRFDHSQEFSAGSRGSVTIELPQHQSLLGSANLQQQLGMLNAGVNVYGSRSLRGITADTSEADLYLETNARLLGSTGYRYAVGATASSAHTGADAYGSTMASQGMHVRMFSKPVHLDTSTTLTHTWSVGQAWANGGRSGMTVLSTLSATRNIGSLGNIQLSYDFTKQPVNYVDSGQHRLSSTIYLGAGSKVSFFMYGSTLLDAPYRSLTGDARYNFARRWHVGMSANVQQMLAASYQDYELTLSRSIGLRDVSITYSTLSHRFYFDMEASRF